MRARWLTGRLQKLWKFEAQFIYFTHIGYIYLNYVASLACQLIFFFFDYIQIWIWAECKNGWLTSWTHFPFSLFPFDAGGRNRKYFSIIDILTIAFTMQYHQIQWQLNWWEEFSRLNNKFAIIARKPLLISTSRNMRSNITDSEIISSMQDS